MRKTRIGYVSFVLGLLLCLCGALLMVAGEPLLGENHSGIATVIGIVGIGLIANHTTRSGLRSSKTRSLEGEKATSDRLSSREERR